MARKQGVGSTVIREYLSKHKDIPSLTAAKALYKKYPELWGSVEHCRGTVRLVRGTSGKQNKKALKDNSLFQAPKKSTTWYLPPSDANKREDFDVPSGVSRLGVLSDIHLPYHDESAVRASVQYLKEKKIDALLLNGDTLDFYALSSHEKDPRKRRFSEEIQIFKDFIKWIKQELNCPIYFKMGNHEYRYERYMMIKAPELLDVSSFSISEILEFGANGIIEIKSRTRVRAGKFTIYHGHEFRGSGGVNPARWLSLKAKISAMVGHFHKASEHVWKDSNDNIYSCYSLGCLCEMFPEYLPENEWTHGFAFIELNKDGSYVVHNKKIINGRVY